MSTNLQESNFLSASDTGLNAINPPGTLNQNSPLNSKGLAFRDRNAIEFYFVYARSAPVNFITATLQGSADNQTWFDDTSFTPVQIVAGVIPIFDLITTSFKRSYSAGISATDRFSWSLGGNGTALKQLNHNYIRLANIVANGATSTDSLTVTAIVRKFLG